MKTMTTPAPIIVYVTQEEDAQLTRQELISKYAPSWVEEGNYTLKKSYEATIFDNGTIRNMFVEKTIAYLFEPKLTPEERAAYEAELTIPHNIRAIQEANRKYWANVNKNYNNTTKKED